MIISNIIVITVMIIGVGVCVAVAGHHVVVIVGADCYKMINRERYRRRSSSRRQCMLGVWMRLWMDM